MVGHLAPVSDVVLTDPSFKTTSDPVWTMQCNTHYREREEEEGWIDRTEGEIERRKREMGGRREKEIERERGGKDFI